MSLYNFEKIYEEGKIKGFERELVADGICKSFIPASFIREEDRIKVIYSYDGYVKLSELRLNAVEILELIESIILKIEEAADLLVDFNRLSFDTDTLFYNQESRDVRMAFVVSDEGCVFSEKLSSLFCSLKDICTEDGAFLDRLSRSALKGNTDLSVISERVRKLKIELRKIG